MADKTYASKFNAVEALVGAYDPTTDTLKTTVSNADVNINVSAFTDSIKVGDAVGNTVSITEVGEKKALDVNVTDITLDHSNDSVKVGDGVNTVGTSTSGEKTGLNVSLI